MIDIIFSLDSVITAVGMVNDPARVFSDEGGGDHFNRHHDDHLKLDQRFRVEVPVCENVHSRSNCSI
jgi:hypothetical protein